MKWLKEPDVLSVVEIPVTVTERRESYILQYRHSADLEIADALHPFVLTGVCSFTVPVKMFSFIFLGQIDKCSKTDF